MVSIPREHILIKNVLCMYTYNNVRSFKNDKINMSAECQCTIRKSKYGCSGIYRTLYPLIHLIRVRSSGVQNLIVPQPKVNITSQMEKVCHIPKCSFL